MARRRPLRARRRWHWPKITRDLVLFTLGVAGIVHEVAVRDPDLPERFYILATCLALCGLPVMLGLDERWQRGKDDPDGP